MQQIQESQSRVLVKDCPRRNNIFVSLKGYKELEARLRGLKSENFKSISRRMRMASLWPLDLENVASRVYYISGQAFKYYIYGRSVYYIYG